MILFILEQSRRWLLLAVNDIQQLTANQLDIARKMTLVLEPVEETTQVISTMLSVVIPFVWVLLRSWEGEEDDRNSYNET